MAGLLTHEELEEIGHQVIEVTLLFHSSSPWTHEKRERWFQLTASGEATTKVLCDTLRRWRDAIGEPGSLRRDQA